MENIELLYNGKGFELPLPAKENWILLKEEGYSPVQSVVAAAGACGGYVYADILKNSNIPFVFHGVNLKYDRDKTQKTNPLVSVTIEFIVSVDATHQSKAQSAVKLVSKYCPVIQALNPSIHITELVTFQ